MSEYNNILTEKFNEANNFLDELDEIPSKSCAVFDIDETALSTEPLTTNGTLNKSSSPEQVIIALTKAVLEPIQGSLTLYKRLQKSNIPVFFITARPEITSLRQATISNLQAAGYNNWQDIFFAPVSLFDKKNFTRENRPDLATYKLNARKKIAAMGYWILLNMGDKPSDISGGYAQKTILLPNFFY